MHFSYHFWDSVVAPDRPDLPWSVQPDSNETFRELFCYQGLNTPDREREESTHPVWRKTHQLAVFHQNPTGERLHHSSGR